ncbi:MAG: hypothetical protein ACLP50_13635 [Solirubrobacteraceae bacterium]
MSGMLPTPPTIPLWARWALSFAVAAALLVSLVVFVDHNNNPNSLASQNPAAVVRANREAETLVAQDQAPRVAVAATGLDPRAALERAVRADMTQRLQSGQIDGPLQSVRCAGHGSRPGFSCAAMAASVNYDYLGVVDVHARRVTFCRRDPPPVPSENVPVSRRCLG